MKIILSLILLAAMIPARGATYLQLSQTNAFATGIVARAGTNAGNWTPVSTNGSELAGTATVANISVATNASAFSFLSTNTAFPMGSVYWKNGWGFSNTMVVGSSPPFSTNPPYSIGGTSYETNPLYAGQFNTYLGVSAGESTTTGNGNSIIGYRAGQDLENGSQSTFLGWQAGQHITDGYHNTYIGAGAGQADVHGTYNVIIGTDAGLNFQDGVRDTFVGTQAGGVSSGDRNVGVGFSAGMKLLRDENVFIGDQAGLFATNAAKTVAIGHAAGYNDDGLNNVWVGWHAGYGSLTGSNNVAIGSTVGDEPTNMADNVFLGYQAAGQVEGNQNVVIGSLAASSRDSGAGNVAIGYNALGSISTPITNTTAVGYQALAASTNNSNTGFGYRAGLNLVKGNNNTFVGYVSDGTSGVGLTNATAIGASAVATNNNSVVLGSASVTGVRFNKFKFEVRTTTPSGAECGTGGIVLWSSNAVLHVSASTDGSTETTARLGP